MVVTLTLLMRAFAASVVAAEPVNAHPAGTSGFVGQNPRARLWMAFECQQNGEPSTLFSASSAHLFAF
jgi:hypothetical protein